METHLIVSRSAEKTLFLETGRKSSELRELADCYYPFEDIGCRLASGSFRTAGMIIAPCSVHTMSAIAAGISSNLLIRAADVSLKERRPLILMVRETPFNLAHLRNMTAVTEMGGIIFPPLPSFYQHPASIAEMVDHSVGRVLDLFQIPHQLTPEWLGLKSP